MDPSDESSVMEHEDRSARRGVWMRGLFMLLLMIAFGIAQGLLWLVAIVQFLWLFFAGEPNRFLMRFGASLALWLGETARYVSCATEAKPFPWAPWPSAD